MADMPPGPAIFSGEKKSGHKFAIVAPLVCSLGQDLPKAEQIPTPARLAFQACELDN